MNSLTTLCRRDAWNQLDAGCISDVCDMADNRYVIKRENLKKRGFVDSVLIWIKIIKFITNYWWFIYLWSISQKIHPVFLIFSSLVSLATYDIQLVLKWLHDKPLTKPESDSIGSTWITLSQTFCHLVSNTVQGLKQSSLIQVFLMPQNHTMNNCLTYT